MITDKNLTNFIIESNRIEGIEGIRPKELNAAKLFLGQPLTMINIAKFVSIYEPGAEFRSKKGQDVYIGTHTPLAGGEAVIDALAELLPLIVANKINSQDAHMRYETLHPLTDCNGRSGRMIWLYQIADRYDESLGFLRQWYNLLSETEWEYKSIMDEQAFIQLRQQYYLTLSNSQTRKIT